jgi:hypothetical protein
MLLSMSFIRCVWWPHADLIHPRVIDDNASPRNSRFLAQGRVYIELPANLQLDLHVVADSTAVHVLSVARATGNPFRVLAGEPQQGRKSADPPRPTTVAGNIARSLGQGPAARLPRTVAVAEGIWRV